MKDAIVARAAAGCSVIVSSHLLSLVEEISHRVLILHGGRKVIHGSLAEISASLPQISRDASLEEIFFQVTDREEAPPAGTLP
jgi:ABC-2 type transport system ATP-binding protein